MSDLTDERGADYGHPADHHTKTSRLIDILLDGKAPTTPVQWQACMVLDKLARLSHTWTHRDSIADIKGYAECMEMTLDAERPVHFHLDCADCALRGLQNEVECDLSPSDRNGCTWWQPADEAVLARYVR